MSEEMNDEEIWDSLRAADGIERAEILQELGVPRYFNRGAFVEAAAAAASAAELFEASGHVEQRAQCQWGQAICYERMGQDDDALDHFTKAKDGFNEAIDEMGAAESLDHMAALQIGRGHYEIAISNFEDAIGLSISAGQERRAADFAMEHGELLGQLGRQSQALERFEWARSLYRGNEAVRAVAKADDRAAACLIDLGRLDDALGLLRNVLAVAEMTNDTAFQTHARYRLGWTLQLADNYEEALEYLSKARDGYDDLDDILGAAKCDQVAASALGQINREDEALDLFRRVRAVFDAAGDDHSVIVVEANMSVIHRDRGECGMRRTLPDCVCPSHGTRGLLPHPESRQPVR